MLCNDLDVKALIGGDRVPVKVLVSTDKYAPVKCIGPGRNALRHQAIARTEAS